MRNEFFAAVCVLSIFGLGVGCGDSDSEGSSSGSSAELAALERERQEILCACHNGTTYSDSLCVAARSVNYGVGDCTLGLLDRPEFAEYTQCSIEVQKSLNECERVAECDPDNYCYQEHEEAFDSCYDLLPAEVMEEARYCPFDSAFECVGGGTVDTFFVCNYYEDCADGSDEAGCLF